jgi:hypothetical protein
MTDRTLRRLELLKADCAAVAATEFALAMPLLLSLTLGMTELANYVLVREQISQLALLISDNAARMGTQNHLQSAIDEKQINDLLDGANLQAGNLDLLHNGRIILSSLEKDPTAPYGQYIHWQRCFGNQPTISAYGPQGTGKGNTDLAGMGRPSALVKAADTVPVIYVEIQYNYQPIIGSFNLMPTNIVETSAMQVRDSRDLSGTGINPVSGVTARTCT